MADTPSDQPAIGRRNFLKGTVGLQHATMAMYNAWCDRVPVYVMIGNILEADKRSSAGAEWPHSAIDPALHRS